MFKINLPLEYDAFQTIIGYLLIMFSVYLYAEYYFFLEGKSPIGFIIIVLFTFGLLMAIEGSKKWEKRYNVEQRVKKARQKVELEEQKKRLKQLKELEAYTPSIS